MAAHAENWLKEKAAQTEAKAEAAANWLKKWQKLPRKPPRMPKNTGRETPLRNRHHRCCRPVSDPAADSPAMKK